MKLNKRGFLKSLIAVPVLVSMGLVRPGAVPSRKAIKGEGGNLKTSLNAYSFNEPLSKGEMDLDDLLEFCASHHFDAVDLTGYYFPGYPEVPSDRYIYDIKRKAFRLGLEISGTGVRNDFTDPDQSRRKKDIELVKNWILAAEKMGAPVIRIFSGTQNPEGYSWEQVAEWMMKDIQECITFGKNHGVVVAVQNHNDFIQTADHVEKLMQKIGSPWFGLILDTGSYGAGDPYEEIAKSIPYAVSWQIKEKINRNGKEEEIELEKLLALIKSSDYSGYLPIETLGPGNPFEKVPFFLEKVRLALEKDYS
ncbi:MAG: sugar phosphate isomerase/epimerase family protein [Anditalea sp.]